MCTLLVTHILVPLFRQKYVVSPAYLVINLQSISFKETILKWASQLHFLPY
ncbi:uncharacterized protein LACBIDRAFT_310102 [Laccaria bicolor S238N-H82]|uniref:Predicted protein n=1 Tax=Laccaria bicolor (strain S238N-H82 / ATCC MYA-4686) TaxID=486041 RepID=B0DTN4_LACBS|nr:uncharacterized protein LACBIDRAFT_310102 [Laccaria bicolor S238N-H82]EDR02090.1 predicted protein [Laccaria bicolor S238N-H82]|eukprot:XP_001887247.1 predicted protein [Laccaria bicolor S238N-H82]